jgi:DNA-directed RNA polymerase subunit RPC12/RpoP
MPEVTEDVREIPLDPYLVPGKGVFARLSENALEVDCSGCGSIVEFEPPEVAGDCPFCGAKIVAQPRAADPLISPEGILPFVITQKQAAESIRDWISTRPLAPNALKKTAQQGRAQGVYVPFWTFDSQTYSRYRGERGEHYWVTETYRDSEGRTQTRQVMKTRWYPASGSIRYFFNDVLVPGTTSVLPHRLDALEPWDLGEIRPYEPAYLSGFKAQRYQIDPGTGFEKAKGIMAGYIHSMVCRDIGGDVQRVHWIETDHSHKTFKHLLLPIWVSAYRYEGRVYQVVVNARTGEVQGDRPWSIWKILLLVLTIAAIAFAIYYYTQSQN